MFVARVKSRQRGIGGGGPCARAEVGAQRPVPRRHSIRGDNPELDLSEDNARHGVNQRQNRNSAHRAVHGRYALEFHKHKEQDVSTDGNSMQVQNQLRLIL